MIRSRILTGAHELAFTGEGEGSNLLRDGGGAGAQSPSHHLTRLRRVCQATPPQMSLRIQ